MMVDDAHSSGVLGRNGRGTSTTSAYTGAVDIQVGTLSKAIGALGGYCVRHPAILLSTSTIARARSFSPPRIRLRLQPPALRRLMCWRTSRN